MGEIKKERREGEKRRKQKLEERNLHSTKRHILLSNRHIATPTGKWTNNGEAQTNPPTAWLVPPSPPSHSPHVDFHSPRVDFHPTRAGLCTFSASNTILLTLYLSCSFGWHQILLSRVTLSHTVSNASYSSSNNAPAGKPFSFSFFIFSSFFFFVLFVFLSGPFSFCWGWRAKNGGHTYRSEMLPSSLTSGHRTEYCRGIMLQGICLRKSDRRVDRRFARE